MDLISYFACIFIRSTYLLTSNALTSLAVFGGRKAQLRDPERLCVESLERAIWQELLGQNLLPETSLEPAVSDVGWLLSLPIIPEPKHRGVALRCDCVTTTPRWELLDDHLWNLFSASKQCLPIMFICHVWPPGHSISTPACSPHNHSRGQSGTLAVVSINSCSL